MKRALDNLLGRGEAAVTVPPLDGAFLPNRVLDEARQRVPLDAIDSLAVVNGQLVASADEGLYALVDGGHWTLRESYGCTIADLAAVAEEGLAIALGSGNIVIEGGRFDGRRYRADSSVNCITALAVSGTQLYVANGSAKNGASDWQRDLLERNASGSIWRIDLDSGEALPIASGLAWPAGIAIESDAIVYTEAWKHRLMRTSLHGSPGVQMVQADLPFYPGRLAPGKDGWWLALFAPRSQLVEFVLREPAYRNRMMAEVAPPYWVSPKLRSGRSFYESLQGGGVKHLGILKPWAPTMSAGLCVMLDATLRPKFSLHSRADGATHGVTGVCEHGGHLHVAAHGDGVMVSLPVATILAGWGGER
ncbi:MAG: strictosidine synthase [Hyphomicrobiales bacterium]|nr:strictosidine synthase [Hyphomicrobiales bacterium]